MPPPKVTVIIPTYNRARYLGEAIGSVLAQTFADFELIVVDDGSTDDTPALLAETSDPRLHRLRQDHRGVSAALNTGIRASQGVYIARLDSDDVWRPDMLHTLSAVLDTRPEISVVYGIGQAMDAGGRLLRPTRGMPLRFRDDALRSMLYEDCTCSITTVARRSCFDRVGWYDESLPPNEDWDMSLRMAQHYRFAFVDRVLAYYRRHDDNMTARRSMQFRTALQTRTKPLDKFFSQPDLSLEAAAMRPVAYENVHLYCGLLWLRVRDLGNAGRELGRALRVARNPLRTVVRIVWFALIAEYLGRCALGQRLIVWLTGLRRRWLREGAP